MRTCAILIMCSASRDDLESFATGIQLRKFCRRWQSTFRDKKKNK